MKAFTVDTQPGSAQCVKWDWVRGTKELNLSAVRGP